MRSYRPHFDAMETAQTAKLSANDLECVPGFPEDGRRRAPDCAHARAEPRGGAQTASRASGSRSGDGRRPVRWRGNAHTLATRQRGRSIGFGLHFRMVRFGASTLRVLACDPRPLIGSGDFDDDNSYTNATCKGFDRAACNVHCTSGWCLELCGDSCSSHLWARCAHTRREPSCRNRTRLSLQRIIQSESTLGKVIKAFH